VLASAFMSTGGVAKRIIRFSIATVGHFRGGLAMASVLACMMFAALSGSSPATVVAIGTIAIAGMRQVGYSKEFAAGVIANAGTLGILIPPSIVMVVYAAATNVSVGRMFLAGVMPGIVAGLMLMIAIYRHRRAATCRPKNGRVSARSANGGKEAGWGLFLIVIIIGGIYGGVFTPTEAAAVAAVYAFFIALFVYRDMGPMKDAAGCDDNPRHAGVDRLLGDCLCAAFFFVWMVLSFFVPPIGKRHRRRPRMGSGWRFRWRSWLPMRCGAIRNPARLTCRAFCGRPAGLGPQSRADGPAFPARSSTTDTRKVMVDSSKTIIMLMFIIVNALLFAHVLTSERIPQAITDWMVGAGFNWFTFLIAVNLLLLLGGQFMEPSGLLLIVAPVVFRLPWSSASIRSISASSWWSTWRSA
jgi:C4-dicarboxylate transporter DctM subunit